MKKNVRKTVGDNHAVRDFDMSEFGDRGPRVVDDGSDALDRAYSDGALERLGAGNVRGAAGLTDSWLGDTRDLAYAPERFIGNNGEAYVGGQNVPVGDVRPNPQNGEPYELLREGMEPGTGPVRVGPNFILNPGLSGLAPASDARFPGADTSVLKSQDGERRPVTKGTFSDVVFRNGDNAEGFIGG